VYKYTIGITWISRFVRRVSRRSSNEVCRHEKSNKNRKKRETNMSRVCLKEVHATIAFACVDSQSLIQRRAPLPEAAIERCHSSMYNGDDKNGARSPTLNTVQMLDLNKFKILYTLVRVLQQVRLILSKHRFVLLVSSICNYYEANLLYSSVPHLPVSRFVRNRVPHKKMRTFCKSL
jgi:hypothetical protein